MEEKLLEEIRELLLTFDRREPYTSNTAKRILWLVQGYYGKQSQSEATQERKDILSDTPEN